MAGIFLTTDLMFQSRVTSVARERGYQLAVVPSAADCVERAGNAPAKLVLIDLTLPGLNVTELADSLRQLSPAPAAVVAFGPHVHAAKLAAAREAGCQEVLTRGQFDAHMASLLERYLG